MKHLTNRINGLLPEYAGSSAPARMRSRRHAFVNAVVSIAAAGALVGCSFAMPSSAFAADETAGQITAEADQQEATYTVPVQMIKKKDDTASMAAKLLYNTAFVQKQGDAYQVTVYLVNAEIMNSTIYSSSLGAATYDKAGDGVMVPADNDTYDAATQVRSVTMTLSSLDTPVLFDVSMMDAVRLKFDPSHMTEGTAPEFPVIHTGTDEFVYDTKHVIGGSGYDGANTMDVLPNGNYVVAGDTDSVDQSFADRTSDDEEPYLSIVSPDGEALSTATLSGADSVSVFRVAAASDGSYYASGYYQMKDADAAASGDFAGLEETSSGGLRHGFVAKFNGNNKLVWVKGVSGASVAQMQGVTATADGGCLAVAEIVGAGGNVDYGDEFEGPVNALVVKYAADGSVQWHKALTGGSGTIASTSGAVTQLADGSYLVAGKFTHSSGTFTGAQRFGTEGKSNMFDLFALVLDENGQTKNLYTYGGSATNEDVNAVIATADGGFALAGSTESSDGTFEGAGTLGSNGYVLKCAADGTVQWKDVLTGTKDNEAVSLAELEDGGYVVLGQGESQDGAFEGLSKGQSDAFVATYSADGTRTGLSDFGGSKKEYAAHVVALHGKQYAFYAESASSDVDMADYSRGGDGDGVLVVAGNRTQEDVTHEAEVQQQATQMEDLLNRLPDKDEVTVSDEAYIQGVRDRFDNLSAEATALIPSSTIARLAAAEQGLEDAKAQAVKDRAAAEAVEKRIAALPAVSKVKVADEAKVSAVQKAYDALSANQKKLVTNGATLTKLQNRIATLKKAAKAAKAKKQATVTVNAKTVTASAVAKAVKKAGSSKAKVTTIVLGSKVKTVKAKALAKYAKVKTITVKSKKLTKKGVKNALKGSKVKTVKVSVSSKAKTNKKYVKKYKKIFTKANAGKKVTVKAGK